MVTITDVTAEVQAEQRLRHSEETFRLTFEDAKTAGTTLGSGVVMLFDDTVDSLALFDPLTGEILRKVPRYTVYPGSHYVTPKERLIGAIDQIREELRDRLKVLREQNKLVEAQRLEQRTLFDMEMMKEVGYCAGIENYSRYLSGRAAGEPPPCLFDYLPGNALLVIDESHQTIPQLGAMFKGDRSRKETLVEYGFRLPSALDNRPLKFEEFEARMRQVAKPVTDRFAPSSSGSEPRAPACRSTEVEGSSTSTRTRTTLDGV